MPSITPSGRVKLFYNQNRRYFTRFALTGLLNTAIDAGIFILMLEDAGLHYTLCQLAGYSAGTANSFVMNKYWTFGNPLKNKQLVPQIWKFLAVNAVSLLITVLGMLLLVENLRLPELTSKGLIILLSQIINYFGYKCLVFNDERK